MVFAIDFNSDEAIYVQLCNQIITCIAMDEMHEGDILPSVRQLADVVGVNMHTVNKAYSVLREEGFIKLDRRRGAVIAVDVDKIRAMQELTDDMRVIVAKALCKNLTPEEIHTLVDEIISECYVRYVEKMKRPSTIRRLLTVIRLNIICAVNVQLRRI